MKQEKPEICALVPYFRNQIGERVVFTEDEDNPYYKQASPGITDYFPSVQDKQKKGNLFLEPKQTCKAALGKYKATFTLTMYLPCQGHPCQLSCKIIESC